MSSTSSATPRFLAALLLVSTAGCAGPATAPRRTASYPATYPASSWQGPGPSPGPAVDDHVNGFHLGAALGFSNGTGDEGDFEQDIANRGHPVSVSHDDSGLAWKAWGLYRFLDHFGVQLGFTQLNVPDSTVRQTGPPGMGAPPLTAVVDDQHPLAGYGPTLSAKVFTPEWHRMSLFAQAGLWYWIARIDVDIPGAGSTKVKEEGIDFFGGAGVQVYAGEGFHFQLGWERYFLDGYEVDFFSGGLSYGF